MTLKQVLLIIALIIIAIILMACTSNTQAPKAIPVDDPKSAVKKTTTDKEKIVKKECGIPGYPWKT